MILSGGLLIGYLIASEQFKVLFTYKTSIKEPDEVKCDTCKHKIDRIDAQTIKFGYITETYCPEHKKPYSKIKTNDFNYNRRYYAELEVDEQGVPVGYKKIK